MKKELVLLLLTCLYCWQQSFANQNTLLESYDCSYRYYNPKIGRMTRPDDQTPGGFSNLSGLNRFSYVFNNPLKYNDPDGHVPQDPSDIQNMVPVAPNTRRERLSLHPRDGSSIGAKYDPSRPLVMSDVAIALTDRKHVDHFMAEIQKTVGGEANFLAVPASGLKMFIVNNPGTDQVTIKNYDFYVLGIQPKLFGNRRSGSASDQLVQTTMDLFNLTRKNAFNDAPAISIFVGDGQADPVYTRGGGGRTYTDILNNYESGSGFLTVSAIYLDATSQTLLPTHQGPPAPFPLGFTAFHEMFVHAGESLKRGNQPYEAHNTLMQDIMGVYDQGHKLDNELIVRAYNENNPKNPIPERAHYRYSQAPGIRKFLFHDAIFRKSRPKAKKE